MKATCFCRHRMLRAFAAGVLLAIGLPGSRLLAQGRVVAAVALRTIEGTARSGAPLFGRVAGGTRLSNGTIVISDASANSLRYFDVRGRLTQTVGRPGEGPGEFSSLQWVRQCGIDTLFAYDALPRRLSVFTASGRFVRQFQATGTSAVASCSRLGALALIGIEGQTSPPEGASVFRVTAPLQVTESNGLVHALGPIATVDIAQVGRGWLPRPGGMVASVAMGLDRVLVCSGDSTAIAVYSLGGIRGRGIALNEPNRAPARRHLERSADAMVAIVPPAMRDSMRARLLRVQPPASLPACSKVLTDAADNVWVQLSVPGDSVTRLRSFARNGTVIESVNIPGEIEVLEIGSDYLLASGETDAGEPFIRLYQLRRGR